MRYHCAHMTQRPNRSTFGVPLKTFGYNGSNELCGKDGATKSDEFSEKFQGGEGGHFQSRNLSDFAISMFFRFISTIYHICSLKDLKGRHTNR